MNRNAYIGRCVFCNEVVGIGFEHEEIRREFERDGMYVELIAAEDARELFAQSAPCICHKPEALRAEVARLKAQIAELKGAK